jgi:prevent-host-death family protein
VPTLDGGWCRLTVVHNAYGRVQMAYVSIRDMRVKPREVWDRLKREREVVVTSNGRPIAVLASVDGDPVEVLRSFRAARAQSALTRLRSAAAAAGAARLSADEIEEEIRAVRQDRRR